ncbi:antileukoproteinase [Tupaia chinensis]|uniref:antileukoproteinase n=1 Tax=Tupaia chinensis TaxID=246437 RepID=UPI0003C8D747|nr:antileukoproteinase [Tupaia chinensis]
MKSSSLFLLVGLLALGTLAPWAVEGAATAFKAGACPPIKAAQCLAFEEPMCNSDWNCPENKKCCADVCGIKCLAPVTVSSQVKKPGKCPKVDGQCMMLNPPNFCEEDKECQDNLKCCMGMCGKVCVDPQKA